MLVVWQAEETSIFGMFVLAMRCGWIWFFNFFVDSNFLQGGGSGTQQIIIEGPLCEDYYKIRDYLYSQFYLL